MRSDPKVVEHLNTQLTNELTAINQYFLHARTLRHWGVTLLGKHEYEESIEEMRHADWLIERILFLGGLPNVQRLNQVMVGETRGRDPPRRPRASRRRRSATSARASPIAKRCATTSRATSCAASWRTRRSTSTSSTASST